MGTVLFTIGIIILGAIIIISTIIMGIYVMESNSKIVKIIFWGGMIGISIGLIIVGLKLGVSINF